MTLIWAGSYTKSMGGNGRGISALRLTDRGLQFFGLAVSASSPSFLARGNLAGVLYATDEGGGRVEAFRRAGGTSLKSMGGQPTSGQLPCHLTVTPDWLYCANYRDGSVDVFPLAPDGKIGPLAFTLHGEGSGPNKHQEGPHAHATLVYGDTMISTDFGADRVYVNRWVDGEIRRESELVMPAGTGPRDFAVSPVAGKIYLIGEVGGSIFVLSGGKHPQIVQSGTTDAAEGDHGAGLVIDPTGRFLYTCLRGSNRVIGLDANTLATIADVSTGGEWPRSLCMVGNLLLVGNQRTGTVVTFSIDTETGALSPSGTPLPVDTPTYLLPAL